jgi:hypothetical protein
MRAHTADDTQREGNTTHQVADASLEQWQPAWPAHMPVEWLFVPPVPPLSTPPVPRRGSPAHRVMHM